MVSWRVERQQTAQQRVVAVRDGLGAVRQLVGRKGHVVGEHGDHIGVPGHDPCAERLAEADGADSLFVEGEDLGDGHT